MPLRSPTLPEFRNARGKSREDPKMQDRHLSVTECHRHGAKIRRGQHVWNPTVTGTANGADHLHLVAFMIGLPGVKLKATKETTLGTRH